MKTGSEMLRKLCYYFLVINENEAEISNNSNGGLVTKSSTIPDQLSLCVICTYGILQKYGGQPNGSNTTYPCTLIANQCSLLTG